MPCEQFPFFHFVETLQTVEPFLLALWNPLLPDLIDRHPPDMFKASVPQPVLLVAGLSVGLESGHPDSSCGKVGNHHPPKRVVWLYGFIYNNAYIRDLIRKPLDNISRLGCLEIAKAALGHDKGWNIGPKTFEYGRILASSEVTEVDTMAPQLRTGL